MLLLFYSLNWIKNKTSNEEVKVIKSFSKFKKLHPKIDLRTKKNKINIDKLSKRLSELKVIFSHQRNELNKVSSVLLREKKPTISNKDLRKLYCQKVPKSSQHKISFNLPGHNDKIKALSAYSIKRLDVLFLTIYSLNEEDYELLDKFLLSLDLAKLEDFEFEGYSYCYTVDNRESTSEFWKVYSCSSFFLGLRNAVSITTKKITLWNLEFSSNEFSKIIRAAKKTKELKIICCRINTDSEYDFGDMNDCQMKTMEINCVRVYEDRGEWNDISMNILPAILSCYPLLKNLKCLVYYCHYTIIDELEEIAKKILDDNYEETKNKLKLISKYIVFSYLCLSI